MKGIAQSHLKANLAISQAASDQPNTACEHYTGGPLLHHHLYCYSCVWLGLCSHNLSLTIILSCPETLSAR